jgi:hypothetical protein
LALVLTAALAACQGGHPAPYRLRVEADAPVSAGGLRPLEGTPFDEVWMAPDFDPHSRTRVQVVEGIVVQTDPSKRVGGSSGVAPARYRLSDAQRTQIARDFAHALEVAVEGSGSLELVALAGADGLVLRASIDPLEMLAPMQPSGRDDVLVSQTADLTLHVELRDPQTDRVLMRVVETRAVRGIPSTRAELQQAELYRVSPSSNLSDIRRALQLFSGDFVRQYVRILERPPVVEGVNPA